MSFTFIDCIINIYSANYKLVKRMAEIYTHGQVVIPKYIRDMFNLTPGTQVQIIVENNEIKIKPQDKVLEEFRALCAMADMTDAEVEKSILKTREKRQKEWLNVP